MKKQKKSKQAEERQEFVVAGKQWMLNHGVVDNQVIFDDVWFNLRFCSRWVKNVTLDVDLNNRKLYVNIFLGRFGILFANKKKLSNRIVMVLDPLSEHYGISINICRYKGDKTGESRTDKNSGIEAVQRELEATPAQSDSGDSGVDQEVRVDPTDSD